jgi:hypothetical protein
MDFILNAVALCSPLTIVVVDPIQEVNKVKIQKNINNPNIFYLFKSINFSNNM